MMAKIVHFSSTGINVKIRPSVEFGTLGALHRDCFATRRKNR